MRKPEDAGRNVNSSQGQRVAKRPYNKPAVRCERVFETSALSCGKVGTTQSQCRLLPKSS
jgi:hypothetical protein